MFSYYTIFRHFALILSLITSVSSPRAEVKTTTILKLDKDALYFSLSKSDRSFYLSIIVPDKPEAILRRSGYKIHVFLLDRKGSTYRHFACGHSNSSGHYVFGPLPRSPRDVLYIVYETRDHTRKVGRANLGEKSWPQAPSGVAEATCADQKTNNVEPSASSLEILVEAKRHKNSIKEHVLLHVTRSGLPVHDLVAAYNQAAFAVAFEKDTLNIVPANVFQLTPTEIEVAKHSGHDLDDIVGTESIHLWDGASVVGDLSVHLTFPNPGDYRVWLELGVGETVAAFPLDVVVR